MPESIRINELFLAKAAQKFGIGTEKVSELVGFFRTGISFSRVHVTTGKSLEKINGVFSMRWREKIDAEPGVLPRRIRRKRHTASFTAPDPSITVDVTEELMALMQVGRQVDWVKIARRPVLFGTNTRST